MAFFYKTIFCIINRSVPLLISKSVVSVLKISSESCMVTDILHSSEGNHTAITRLHIKEFRIHIVKLLVTEKVLKTIYDRVIEAS